MPLPAGFEPAVQASERP